MPTLDRLPVELISRVVSLLVGDSSSLFRLCLTSKQLFIVARPALYQIYENCRDEHFGVLQMLPQAVRYLWEPIRPFLLQICRNPHLAALVKETKIGLWQTCSREPNMRSISPLTTADSQMLWIQGSRSDFHRRMSQSRRNQWWTALNLGLEDSDVMLLISSLPQLEVLDIQMPAKSELRKSIASLNHSNLHLKQLHITFVDNPYSMAESDNAFTISEIVSLFTHPSLTQLTVQKLHTYEVDFTFPSGPSAIRLALLDSVLPPHVLHTVVVAAQSLQSFQYTSLADLHDKGLVNIYRALALHRDTLEEVRINHRPGHEFYPLRKHIRKCSFKSFSKLTNIDISADMIPFLDDPFGLYQKLDPDGEPIDDTLVNILPACIQKLTLRCFWPTFIELILPELDGLSADCESRFPDLREVRIMVGDSTEDAFRFRAALISMGICHPRRTVRFIVDKLEPEWLPSEYDLDRLSRFFLPSP